MDTNVTLAQQLCALLIVRHETLSLNRSANSYQIVRLLSRLFSIIDFATTDYLVEAKMLIEKKAQISEYYLTEAGLHLLQLNKGTAFKILQESGHLENDYSRFMAEKFISEI